MGIFSKFAIYIFIPFLVSITPILFLVYTPNYYKELKINRSDLGTITIYRDNIHHIPHIHA